ncbi:Ubiquitin carboxyl-terminal hydrolase MIY1 [Rhodotorula toruloides]|uniref:MINDY deubiquitinase domain-containing protein n=1 Tax=Rhodotorula toruloides TaxID=5286 RepID=A0A2S9ZVX2_RHOTO|nr:Ubiquitin carboxyl-terminal hydrolase MIY1 [Rhodotorula toruloides]PRQ69905.1 Protein of unknown function (DUF544)-domain containing protein [Rhodotorula toruloides]
MSPPSTQAPPSALPVLSDAPAPAPNSHDAPLAGDRTEPSPPHRTDEALTTRHGPLGAIAGSEEDLGGTGLLVKALQGGASESKDVRAEEEKAVGERSDVGEGRAEQAQQRSRSTEGAQEAQYLEADGPTQPAPPPPALPPRESAQPLPASPEDLARQLANFSLPSSSPSTTPPNPQTQEEPEEEWLLKSILWPPLPPTPAAAGQDGPEGVREEFETDENLRVKVICQNANGPCSLIALCNILILRNDLHIAPGRTSVTYSHLSNLLADYFLRVTSSPSANPSSPSTELSLTAALSILPQTRYGLNLNPRFDRIDGFSTSTSSSASGKGELALFALAGIPLLHGWLADPSDPETYDVLVGSEGCKDYDTAMEWVVEGSEVAGGAEKLQLREEQMSEEEMVREVERRSGWSEEQEKKVRRAHLINTFLSSTSTQLSYPGLSALCQSPSLLPPSGLAALFRNSHLSVLYRRPTVPSTPTSPAIEGPELFTLVTDAAFAAEEGILWESLGDTNGEASEFCDAALRRSSVRGGDWVGGRSRGQRSERAESVVQHEGVENPADIALAQQLQAEEDAYERHLVEQQRREERHRQQQEQATPRSRREERVEAQGRTSGAGASSSKASKRLSKMAGGDGKGEKEKCVVM